MQHFNSSFLINSDHQTVVRHFTIEIHCVDQQTCALVFCNRPTKDSRSEQEDKAFDCGLSYKEGV